MNNEQLQAKLSAAEQEIRKLRADVGHAFMGGVESRFLEQEKELAALRLAKEAAERERNAERVWLLGEVRRAMDAISLNASEFTDHWLGGFRVAKTQIRNAIDRIAGSDVSPEQAECAADLNNPSGAYGRLRAYLLNQPWHERCDIVPDYMPPYPRNDTRPSVQIRFNDGTEHPPFLRYSRGPAQGFFWDVYGEDFQDVELAIIALSKAPAPVNVGPITSKIPLSPEQDKEKTA